MPIDITQGRYTREAAKGMIVRPEDRADAVARLIGSCPTFGDDDFMTIAGGA